MKITKEMIEAGALAIYKTLQAHYLKCGLGIPEFEKATVDLQIRYRLQAKVCLEAAEKVRQGDSH